MLAAAIAPAVVLVLLATVACVGILVGVVTALEEEVNLPFLSCGLDHQDLALLYCYSSYFIPIIYVTSFNSHRI